MLIFKDAKVGEKVWTLAMGFGSINSNNVEGDYPILVQFGDDLYSYTLEGKESTKDIHPVLFWQPYEVPVTSYVRNMAIDTKVVVWEDDFYNDKELRHFSHFDEKGRIHCFVDGKTSFSSLRNNLLSTHSWDNWELYEEKNKGHYLLLTTENGR